MVTGMSTGHPVRSLRNQMTREYLKLEKENADCARMAAAQAGASDFGALCRRVPGPMGGVYRQKIIFLTN